MSWNERQRRMLAAMGVRLWSPAPSVTAAAPPVGEDSAPMATTATAPILRHAAIARAKRLMGVSSFGTPAGRPAA